MSPRFSTDLLLRAQGAGLGLQAAIFDVDGVLTDGRLHISGAGEEVKVFHALDGQGLKLLMQAGVTPWVITGRDSAAVRRRLADLGVARAAFGVHDKLACAQHMLTECRLDWSQVAAIGDDWPDLPLLTRAALAVAPANAHPDVRAAVHHVSAWRGGEGAAREFCDLLIMGTGRYGALLAAQSGTLDTR